MRAKVVVSNGIKLYPVCGFERSQHKLHYWYNKAWLAVYDRDGDCTEKQIEELAFWEEVMNYATCVHNGLIYMPYKFYNRVKEAIVAYDLRH